MSWTDNVCDEGGKIADEDPHNLALTKGDKQSEKRALADHRMQVMKRHVLVCNGGCCARQGSQTLLTAFRAAVSEKDASDIIRITETRCTGRCVDSCSVVVYPEGVWYRNVCEEHVGRIVQEHLLSGVALREQVSYVYRDGHFIRAPLHRLEDLSQR